jgi:hypothetical protein
MASIPSNLLSQPTHKYSLIKPEVLHKQINFNITNNAQVNSTTSGTLNAFNLVHGQKKAVAIIGEKVTKLDRSVVPNFINNVTRNRVSMLPEVYFAREEATNIQLSYHILFVDSAPLRFNSAKNVFNGEIRFFAVETNNLTESQSIEKRLAVPETVFVSYREVLIPIIINQINYPPLDATITYANPLDSMEVKILTMNKPIGYSTFLPVEPAIILSSNRKTIQGFGLQTMPVYVTLKGVTSYKPVPLTVISSLGTIDSPKLVLKDDSPTKIIFRSESYGQIDLDVTNANYPSNSLPVIAVFPWMFLILSILGGLIGGIGKKLKGSGKITLRIITYSCIIGLIAAVAYWGLGIKLIQIAFEDRGYNEGMVFAFGLLAGYFGILGISKKRP